MNLLRALLLALVLALAFLPSASAANWTVDGDRVYWNSSWGKITVWPHTATGLTYQEQYANVTWNLAANTLDFAFVFDDPIKGSLYLWSNITETRQTPTLNTIEQTYSCTAPSTHSYTSEVYTCIYANGTTAWTQYYSWKAGDDLSIKTNITYANFTSSTVTVLGWKDITGQVSHQTYGGQDYYLLTSVAMAQGQTRSIRWSYTTPFNTSGKWSLMAKLSSDSIATAYSANRYLILDPWWNTSYAYSRIINVTNLDASLVLQQNYTANLTFNHSGFVADGKSNVSGLDVRVVYNDTTELDRVNVTNWNTSATTIIFKLQANISAGSADVTNYKLYYGNLGANNPPASRVAVVPSAPNLTNVSFLFDLIKGTNVTRLEDVSGQGNNATIINGNWTPGKYGWALDFNATTGYAVMPMTSSINNTLNGTAHAYNVGYCPRNTSLLGTLFDGSAANARGFELQINATGYIRYAIRGPTVNLWSTGALTPGNCYDIWAIWNGTNQSIYINGVFNASTPNSNPALGHGENIQIGAADGASGPANGSFYKAALYNRSLSSAEVAALYIGTEPTLSLLAETTDDSILPNITHLSPANLTTFENRNFTVEVNASDGIGLSEVTVDAGAAGNFTNNTALVNGSNFVTLTGLNDGNITYYTVAKDAAGNINGTAKRIATIDTKNATISAIIVSPISDRAATISFTADRQVNTTITYGTVSGTYTTNTSNTTFSTTPKASLTNLAAVTTYFYRIYTWNLASNFTESAEQNFTTAAILAGGGLGGGGPPGTPEPLEKVKEAIRGAVANITAPKASILYITQDTTACWVHKLSEILPPDSPDPYDPCFPGQLYSGQYTEVGAFAYMTNGSVLSYTWWISTPDLKVQPPKATLTVGLGEGAYPVGVDIATSTGQVFSRNRTVNVVPGLPPAKAGGAVAGEAASNTVRASFSVVGGVVSGLGGAASSGVGTASDDDWGMVVWTNGKATLTKGQAALLLFGGLGYVYFNGRGGKRRR